MSIDRDRHCRLLNVFEATHELPASERPTVLDKMCGDDVDFRDEIDRLLIDADRSDRLSDGAIESDDRFDDLIEFCAVDIPLQSTSLPDRIGPYRVTRLLGEGGMGVVYEAEQDRPRRRVALKIIRPGMLTDPMLRRFRREAEVLGRLTHPGIAHVYDAGVDESGDARTPFIAMELVNGKVLTKYVQGIGLDSRDRLALANKLCDAIEHAHERGIIHRDLKPANILIDDRGQPKILDFGVARITESDVAMTTMQTQVGQIIGTAAYMSPEQASGDPDKVDTRSDVYSLGVIIFELLSNRLPIDVLRMPLHEAIRAIHEAEPTRIGSIDASLRGDIETILAKALSRSPENRYQTVAEFGADIRRYLQNKPIIARPPSTIYQLHKFARRNRALVGSVAAIMVALLIGLIVTGVALSRESRARINAEQSLDRSRAASQFLEQVLLGLEPGETNGRDTELLEGMLAQAESSLKESVSNPTFRAEMLTILGRTYHKIARFEKAGALLDEASLLSASLGGDDVSESDYRLIRADSHMKSGDFDTAEELLEDAAGYFHGLSDTDSEAHALRMLAELHMDTGRLDSALGLIERAIAIGEGAEEIELGRMEMMRGAVLRRLRRFDEARAAYERSLLFFRNIDDKRGMATILNSLGVLARNEGQHGDAAEFYREAIDLRLVVDSRPNPSVAVMLSNLGRSQAALGRADDARKTLERSLAMHIDVYGESHYSIAFPSASLGEVLIDLGEPDRAIDLLKDAIRRLESQFGIDHQLFFMMQTRLAQSLEAAGRFAEAEANFRRGIDLFDSASIDTTQYEPGFYTGLGRTLLAQDRGADARQPLEAAIARAAGDTVREKELLSLLAQCNK